ncbi:MAG TPA: recombinase family protein, partial [Chitinophagaceae bacterium]|nr:recombinase family protein [Chitinophagaceae bacterium]
NQFELTNIFIDDGKSAKNFDRPDWKKLEAFVRKNHSQVDYLVMAKYDRFSRKTKEALQMLELIEEKFNIRSISVMEPIHVSPESPFFFQIRTQILTNAQVEWMIIRDRTRFGNHYAAKAGRYINVPPFGYKKGKDEAGKYLIIVDEAKAPIIHRMYQMLLEGAPLKEIYLEARRMGFPNRGHSETKRILQSPTYAGFIRVPPYNDDPGGYLVKSIHEAIVDQATWYKAQDILVPKAITKTVMNEDVPLRSVLKCFCGRSLTAGNSKGRRNYYWYYKCEDHRKYNHSAIKLHDMLHQLLKELSFPPAHLEYLKERVKQQLQQQAADKELLLQEKRRELYELNRKIDRLEEKYINDDLDKQTFHKFRDRYQREVAVVQEYISDFTSPLNELWNIYEENIRKMENLAYVYEKADLHGKQAFIRQVFKSELYIQDGVYRTPWILPLFAPKAASLKEKRLLIIEQPHQNQPEVQDCAPDQSSLEHFSDFIHLLSRIKIA